MIITTQDNIGIILQRLFNDAKKTGILDSRYDLLEAHWPDEQDPELVVTLKKDGEIIVIRSHDS